MANEASLFKYYSYATSLAFSQYIYILEVDRLKYIKIYIYFFFSFYLFILAGQGKAALKLVYTLEQKLLSVYFCPDKTRVICLSSSLKLLKLFPFQNRNTNLGGTRCSRYLLCATEKRSSQQLAFPPGWNSNCGLKSSLSFKFK